ncbi:MAG: DUF2628 domain-containing protein [Oscillospiraceae bacterium]|nr:DUF2628 domain-containing protein [Oscillospiraceae bacterium]
MYKFENQPCEVCGEVFDKYSDIVTCPECGTPHHRECWHKTGHCVNEHKHGTDFEWQPVKKEPAAGSITCPNCQAVMPGGTLFCENCGHSLSQTNIPQQNGHPANGQPNVQIFGIPGMMGVSISQADANRINKELAGEIDGVPVRDMAVYIGPNAQSYIYKFRRMDSNPKYRPFSWAAFLFTPLWYLFRKMWKTALATAFFNGVMNIPYFIMTAVEMGVIEKSFMFPGIESVASVCQFIVLAVSLVLGFTATPMYRKATVKKLKQLKEETGGDRNLYYRKIMEQAGPSKVGMAVVTMFAIFYLFTAFMPY